MSSTDVPESELDKPDMYYGIWVGKDGKVYCDVSRWFKKLDDAIAFGKKTKQDAVYDITTKGSKPIRYYS